MPGIARPWLLFIPILLARDGEANGILGTSMPQHGMYLSTSQRHSPAIGSNVGVYQRLPLLRPKADSLPSPGRCQGVVICLRGHGSTADRHVQTVFLIPGEPETVQRVLWATTSFHPLSGVFLLTTAELSAGCSRLTAPFPSGGDRSIIQCAPASCPPGAKSRGPPTSTFLCTLETWVWAAGFPEALGRFSGWKASCCQDIPFHLSQILYSKKVT